VVILGCGFGGLAAARGLASAQVRITLLDRSNHHLFQPLLYQVATAGLSAPAIAAPIRHILRRQHNLTVMMAEASGIDVQRRAVLLQDGSDIRYDYLIVATGATHSYFGHDEWAAAAPGLKTLEDALEIRSRVLLAYERAECHVDPSERDAWLTFAVVGAGATGVEMAGTLAEIARHTLREEFRYPSGEGYPVRGYGSSAARLSFRAVGEGARATRTARRRSAHRMPRYRHR
jgi:NADH dehydrogenase